jgi:dCTP deaminase
MFWSGDKLEAKLPDIVSNFSAKNIDCSAYTMAIGHQVYVSRDGDRDQAKMYRSLGHKEQFEIPAGQFAFLLTKEILKIPRNVMALINVKSSIKLKGLVNVSGFHVDPGYSGRLVISVFNAGPSSLVLRADDPCFLIWFCDLDGGSSYYYKKDGFSELNDKLISQVPGNNTSLSMLEKEVVALKARTDFVFNVVIGVGLPFLIAILVAIAQVVASRWFDEESLPNFPKPEWVPSWTGMFMLYIFTFVLVIFVMYAISKWMKMR